MDPKLMLRDLLEKDNISLTRTLQHRFEEVEKLNGIVDAEE